MQESIDRGHQSCLRILFQKGPKVRRVAVVGDYFVDRVIVKLAFAGQIRCSNSVLSRIDHSS
jgi:hypothetical protein